MKADLTVGDICGKTETEAPVSSRNLWPDPMCKEFCSVEPDPHVCNDTSRDRRLYWRTEDVQNVEQDAEPHKKQVEDVV